jgi:imidazolonepropionase-like amidohydrolase
VSVLQVRGYAQPEGEPVDLYADGDRWATDPVAAAELVAEGWLLLAIRRTGSAGTRTCHGPFTPAHGSRSTASSSTCGGGAAVHGQLAAAAAEAGVTILAGTDTRPHGRVTGEIRALAAAGLRPHDAIAAGSWAARSYFGLPGLTQGAPTDVVIYDADPRRDLSQLDSPRAVILRGRLILPGMGWAPVRKGV